MPDNKTKPPMRIEQVWMAIAEDKDGNEGVCAVDLNGQWFPLIAADPERLEFIEQQAAAISRETGKIVRLIKLTARELVGFVDGRYGDGGISIKVKRPVQ